ncbi:hypothetical protein JTB14_019167 [Gonioctena quinquepunctata]|nr:hypothetical protein JTB14_019167 [Gonioctena quinquepunctata]
MLNLNVTTFSNSIHATPVQTTTGFTPVTLSFSPKNDVRSVNSSISSTSTLPKPEQWLEIVNSSSPSPARMDGTSPRRTPSFKAHSRAVSLDTGSENFQANKEDPFDAEWVDMAARQNTNNTNPFLTTKVTPKAFQIQL